MVENPRPYNNYVRRLLQHVDGEQNLRQVALKFKEELQEGGRRRRAQSGQGLAIGVLSQGQPRSRLI